MNRRSRSECGFYLEFAANETGAFLPPNQSQPALYISYEK